MGFPKPFWYQESALNDIRTAYRRGSKAVLFCLPTGGGKTFIAAYIAYHAAQRGTTILFCAHRQELVNQISGALADFGLEHGIIAPWAVESQEPIQVASVDTLLRRMRLDPARERYVFDLVVIDEAHHAVKGNKWGKIIDHCGGRLLGLTATPIRFDGKGLGQTSGGYFDTLVEGPSVLDLVNEGRLCEFVVIAPPDAEIDTSSLRIVRGDFDAHEVEDAITKAAIMGNVVKNYQKYLDGAPTIAFTSSIGRSHEIAERFKEFGYQAAALSGKTSAKERKRIISDLGRGHINVVASCDVISEGTDVPIVKGALNLAPTASLGRYLQKFGRILRIYEGKGKAVWIDHVGTCHRPGFGFPTDDREWALEGKKKRPKGEASMKRCPECYAMNPPAARVCSECGFEFGMDEPEDVEQVEVDMDLAVIDPVQIARERRKKVADAVSLRDLRRLAKEFGYKPGWAWHTWQRKNNRTGV